MTPSPFRLSSKRSIGEVLLAGGYPAEAIPYLEQPVPLPQHLKAKVNLAIAYRQTHRLRESVQLLQHVIAESPSGSHWLPSAWNTLGMLSDDHGEWNTALACYENAAHLMNHPQFDMNRGSSLLRLGRFTDAYPYWENGRINQSWQPVLNLPPWDGQSNGRILIVSEGGYGDAFLYSRFFRCLPEGVTADFWAWDRLGEIFEFWSGVKFIPHSTTPNPSDYIACTSILSLPALLGIKGPADIPSDTWSGISHFRYNRLYNNRTGICWKAEESGGGRPLRSIPDEDLDPLKSIGACISLVPNAPAPSWMLQMGDTNWLDTISIIKALKLVVTVDTAVAHLSCLLGTPTYLLLPMHSEWKWGTGHQDDHWWYGSNLTVIRSQHPTNWSGAIQSLVKELNHA